MKAVFVCPFDLDRLTGTPIRTRSTVRAIAEQENVIVVARAGSIEGIRAESIGKVSLTTFTRHTLRILRRERPDVVHGITTVSIAPMLLYKVMRPRAHLIFEMHGWAWFEEQERGLSLTRIALLFLDLAGLFIAKTTIVMSETQKIFLSRWSIWPHRIVSIWGPCEFEPLFIEPPAREGIVVGYIGNASWWQGLHHIIGAARVLEENTRISFHLAGFDASNKKDFPELRNVSYIGPVARKDVLSFLHGCDVLISSRLNEGVSNLQYPQKLSEYLGAGRPVIVSGANDQPRIIQEADCGIVVEPMTKETLALAIQDILHMPREQRNSKGENAIAFAEKHVVFKAFAEKVRRAYQC